MRFICPVQLLELLLDFTTGPRTRKFCGEYAVSPLPPAVELILLPTWDHLICIAVCSLLRLTSGLRTLSISWLEEGETILQRELQRREAELAMMDEDDVGDAEQDEPETHENPDIEEYGRQLQGVVKGMHGMLAEESSYHGKNPQFQV